MTAAEMQLFFKITDCLQEMTFKVYSETELEKCGWMND